MGSILSGIFLVHGANSCEEAHTWHMNRICGIFLILETQVDASDDASELLAKGSI